jgi:hypothetical protein
MAKLVSHFAPCIIRLRNEYEGISEKQGKRKLSMILLHKQLRCEHSDGHFRSRIIPSWERYNELMVEVADPQAAVELVRSALPR